MHPEKVAKQSWVLYILYFLSDNNMFFFLNILLRFTPEQGEGHPQVFCVLENVSLCQICFLCMLCGLLVWEYVDMEKQKASSLTPV